MLGLIRIYTSDLLPVLKSLCVGGMGVSIVQGYRCALCLVLVLDSRARRSYFELAALSDRLLLLSLHNSSFRIHLPI